jgi:hypothetical protein
MLAQQLINGLVLGSIYALSALGFTLIFGVARVVNFAYGEFLMLGAFLTLTTMTITGVDFFIALPLQRLEALLPGDYQLGAPAHLEWYKAVHECSNIPRVYDQASVLLPKPESPTCVWYGNLTSAAFARRAMLRAAGTVRSDATSTAAAATAAIVASTGCASAGRRSARVPSSPCCRRYSRCASNCA